MSIGLEETEYTVPETDDYHVMCAHVKSGSIAGREINILYIVADTGMHLYILAILYILVECSYTHMLLKILHCHR